jgi:DNA-binding NtrC family response regulator
MLRRGGYAAVAVGSVEEALATIQAAPPHLLLSSPTVARSFQEKCTDLPVLVISGLPDDPSVREAAGFRGLDIFPQPFRADDLLRRVRDVLGRDVSRDANWNERATV